MKSTLYMMVGLPRSGKSTWISENKDRLDAIVIENDWIREHILHAPNSKSTEPSIWMITDACIRILLSQGKNVIFDGINHTKFVRKFFIDLAVECKAKIVMVEMHTPVSECIKRNQTDHKLSDEVIKKINYEMEWTYPCERNDIIQVIYEEK